MASDKYTGYQWVVSPIGAKALPQATVSAVKDYVLKALGGDPEDYMTPRGKLRVEINQDAEWVAPPERNEAGKEDEPGKEAGMDPPEGISVGKHEDID